VNGIARWQGCQGAHMFRMNGIARWQGQFFAPAKIAFPPSMAVMPRSAYVQDGRPFFAPSKNGISHIHVGRILEMHNYRM